MVMCQVYEVKVLTIEVKRVIVILFYRLLIKQFTSLIQSMFHLAKKLKDGLLLIEINPCS